MQQHFGTHQKKILINGQQLTLKPNSEMRMTVARAAGTNLVRTPPDLSVSSILSQPDFNGWPLTKYLTPRPHPSPAGGTYVPPSDVNFRERRFSAPLQSYFPPSNAIQQTSSPSLIASPNCQSTELRDPSSSRQFHSLSKVGFPPTHRNGFTLPSQIEPFMNRPSVPGMRVQHSHQVMGYEEPY
jgi:hypothetical protein